MVTIAHISDLHFSHTTSALLSKILYTLRQAKPTLVVVSGDLTQRARVVQFEDAQCFIEALPHPILIVPGNHDVPLWNVYRRLFKPLQRYRQFACDDLMPVYDDENVYVVGTDTTRAFTLDPFGFWKNGALSARQLRQIRMRFAPAQRHQLRVLVMHHPLVNPWNGGSRHTVRGRRRIIRTLQDIGVDLVLSGHLHKAYSAYSTAITRTGKKILCFQAGTACSTRLRDEPNAFNLLQWDGAKLSLTIHRYNGESFVAEKAQEFAVRPAPLQPQPAI